MDAARRFILVHRRLLAAAFAGLAVLSALAALKPSTPGETVVVARHDLASGTTLAAGDLHTVESTAKPSHAHTSAEDLVGRRVAAPMREGEAVTDYRLLEPALLDGYDEDLVLATVSLADESQLTGLRVGSFVDVVGTDPHGEGDAAIIARRAEIAALPRTPERPSLVLAVPERSGLALASAALDTRISVLSVP